MKTNIENFKHSESFPGGPRCPTQNLGPIGSAVLTFIGYKQTDRQTDSQAKFIYGYTYIKKVYLKPSTIYNIHIYKENIFES